MELDTEFNISFTLAKTIFENLNYDIFKKSAIILL